MKGNDFLLARVWFLRSAKKWAESKKKKQEKKMAETQKRLAKC